MSQGVPQLLSQGLLDVVGRHVATGVIENVYAVVHHWMVVQHGLVAHVSHTDRAMVAS